MNWRSIVGLVFLLAGAARLLMLFNSKTTGNPIYAEAGCAIWMLVGVFLIIKGMTDKPA